MQKSKKEETLARLRAFLTSSPTPSAVLRPDWRSRARLRAAGFIDNPSRPFTWDGWDDTYNDIIREKGSRTVAQLMLDWLLYLQDKTIDQKRYYLWLHGPTGTGKTHIASVAAILWSLAYDVVPVYANWAIRLAEIKASFNGWTGVSHLEEEQRAGVLVLDDLGAERVTLFNLEMLYGIIESRRGLPTIITSNYKVEDYAKRLHTSDRGEDDKTAVAAMAGKIEDRLQLGQGGYLCWELPVRSKQGSYRRKNGRNSTTKHPG